MGNFCSVDLVTFCRVMLKYVTATNDVNCAVKRCLLRMPSFVGPHPFRTEAFWGLSYSTEMSRWVYFNELHHNHLHSHPCWFYSMQPSTSHQSNCISWYSVLYSSVKSLFEVSGFSLNLAFKSPEKRKHANKTEEFVSCLLYATFQVGAPKSSQRIGGRR